ncbi:MAG TPA: NFACT RNA binding domain-containing protein [Longimicrobiaceae bacterium]|nr:NFACT RNA binding domain-containing protein [Longimicrobiaceae bacterium]
MSNALVYDPLLVRYLAGELDQRLRGRACAAAPVFASGRSAVLPLDGGEALALDLHPRHGWIRLVPWDSDAEELDALCLGVEAPPDERRFAVRLHAGERFRALSRRLVVELHTNQWNALLVSEEDDRILSVLWGRTAGERVLQPGAVYRSPAAAPRYGAGAVLEIEARAEWRLRIGAAAPSARRRALLAGFAYTGSANARAVLGTAEEDEGGDALWDAFARWWWLRSLPESEPVLLRVEAGLLPYPIPLPGHDAEPADSLLDAMTAAALAGGGAGTEVRTHPGTAAVERRLAAAEKRVERLESQLAGAGEAARMRHWGDLLLARKRLVPHGAEKVKLQDWGGRLVEVPLDPTLSAAENATRWYDEARRRERADARLPELLAAARGEVGRWEAALAALRAGETPEWLEEVLGEQGSAPAEGEELSRPYRTYRTSGGLEVRVGKNARDNDRLTFAHSAPGDVWLHARSVPGSHVILRWRDEGAPPARDLGEAAALAALFSKARSSSLVPVDWTRRKYVRKPRGAPPGAVVPQRVRTLFVEPDAAVEARMRGEV